MEINDREKLVAAFEHMVENVSESMHKAEEALTPTIDEMVHNAEQLAREVLRSLFLLRQALAREGVLLVIVPATREFLADRAMATRLWNLAEELTGEYLLSVDFPQVSGSPVYRSKA